MQNFLGAIFSNANLEGYEYLEPIVKFLDDIIIPFTVVLAISAAVMALIFSILIAKAEDGDKAKEMKKRLIGLIIAFTVITIIIWVFGFVLSEFATIMGFFRNTLGLFNFN